MPSPSILTVIPARGGSKRIPGKNIRDFCGKPLIQWTIEAAQEAGLHPIVSTDNAEIEKVCLGLSCQVVRRPAELAQDDTPTVPVLQQVWRGLRSEQEWLLCLQPTSPLREIEDIFAALDMAYGAFDETSMVSVTMVPGHDPSKGGATFKTNGAIYLVRGDILMHGDLYGVNPVLHYMPWHRSIDIDTEDDWKKAEVLHANR